MRPRRRRSIRHACWIPALALLASSLAAPARATIAPDARPVVERFIAAIGGRAALDAERSSYEKVTLRAFGMAGASEMWAERPDRSASSSTIGPLKIRDGTTGERAWRTDPAGKTIVLDGKDRDDARSDAWFGNDRWLDADQGGGAITLAGHESDSTATYTVLEVAPPVGRSRRLWFDDKTGLIAREVTKRDQNTIVTLLSDWRRAAGRLRPFHTTLQIVGMPANDVTLVTDSVAVNVAVPAELFAPPSSGPAPPRFLGAPGVARLPFDYATRHVWLKVSVNGAPPADFLFDTGASITVLDSTYAASIGIRTEGHQQGQGAGAVGSASFASLDSLRVAGPDGDGIALQDVKVAVLSIGPSLAPFFWRDAAGVLGFDFIHRFVTEIDYDHHLLVLHDPATFTPSARGTRVPIQLAGATPVVEVTLDGHDRGLCRLDVGSSSTLDLHGPFVEAHGYAKLPGRSVEVTGGGFGGTFKSRIRRMKTLAIGGLTVKGPLVGLSQASAGGFASEDYAGNLGNRLLERFRVTLDYDRRLLILEPGKRFAAPDVFPRAGLQLARVAGVIHVAWVLPGSPAEAAGAREGDEIVAIDGKPAASWTVDGVEEALERGPVASQHSLDIRRDGVPRRLRLRLKEML